MKELEPLVAEYRELEKVASALDGSRRSSGTSARRGRPRSSDASSGRRGRPKGSGARALQAMELIRARPGITIAELADAMSIQKPYLYRVLPTLEEQGKVKKDGKGWIPA